MKKIYYISGWYSSINTVIYGSIFLFLFIPGIIFAQGSEKTLFFNGVDKAIDLGDLVANNCRTIEMWFKPYEDITSSTTPISLIVRDFNNGDGLSTNEFQICFVPNTWSGGGLGGKIAFYRRIGSTRYEIFSDRNEWPANHWYHVAATIEDVDGMKLYINGVLQKSTDPSTAPIKPQSGNITDKVFIGKWGYPNIRYFHGEIDEVRIWETEKSAAEIRSKMCSKLNGNEAGLRAYYKFDTESADLLIDDSQNNYDGQLLNINMVDWKYSGAPIGDTSTYFYDNGLDGQTLKLSTGPGDSFLVYNINSIAKGIQIYKVNYPPNSSINLKNLLTGNYYGVFLCDTSGSFDFLYDYSDYNCTACNNIFSRNDNAIFSWTAVDGINNNCSLTATEQSTVGSDYRSEFIIDNNGQRLGPDLGNDTTVCDETTIILDATIPNALGYKWQDGSTEPFYHATGPGFYKVIVYTDCGISSDSIQLIAPEEDLFIPNVITPNYDGYNDFFRIKGTDFSIGLTIFNRWGKEVYKSFPYNNEWFGQNLSPGVYYYMINTGCSGREYKGWVKVIKNNGSESR